MQNSGAAAVMAPRTCTLVTPSTRGKVRDVACQAGSPVATGDGSGPSLLPLPGKLGAMTGAGSRIRYRTTGKAAAATE